MSSIYIGDQYIYTGKKMQTADISGLCSKGTTIKTWSYTDWDSTSDYPLSSFGLMSQYLNKTYILIWHLFLGTWNTIYFPTVVNLDTKSYLYNPTAGTYTHLLGFQTTYTTALSTGTDQEIYQAHFVLGGYQGYTTVSPSALTGADMPIVTRQVIRSSLSGTKHTNTSWSTFSSDMYMYPYKLISMDLGIPGRR